MNVNKAIIVGRITKDIELRSTNSGQAVASFSVATNNNYTNKEGNKIEETDFHDVTLWGRLAEIAGEYLTKGQEVYIEGRMKKEKYTDKEGIDRYSFKIIGQNMQMGSKPKGHENTQQGAPSHQGKEDIPTINLDDDNEEVNITDVPF